MAQSKILPRFEQTLAALKAQKVAPVYAFYGPERWLRQELVTAVRAAVLQGKGAAFNHDRFAAASTDPATVVDAVSTVPMMGKKRLVEVNDIHLWKADQLSALTPLLDKIPDHACLLLTGDTLDGRTKVVRDMGRRGVVLKLEAPSKRELGTFIDQKAKAKGVRLEPAASAMLVEMVGKDLGALLSSLEKAALYAGEKKTLTASHVRAVVPDLRAVIIFDLTDAVSAGHTEKALDSLRRLLAEKEPPQRILVMLGRQVRLLWMIIESLRAGVSPRELGAHLHLHPFVAKKLAGHSRSASARALRAGHGAICQADRALKGSKVPADVVLERLIIDLCAAARARR
jgi:DNA polymerase-3 subunit delta